MDLNRVSLIGNVAKDPEQKELTSGANVTRVSVATNYSWKQAGSTETKERVNFHTVVAWNGLGKTMAKYLKTGDRVYVEGRVEYREVQGEQGRRYYTDIVADKMIMLGGKKKTEPEEVAVTEELSVEDLPFEG